MLSDAVVEELEGVSVFRARGQAQVARQEGADQVAAPAGVGNPHADALQHGEWELQLVDLERLRAAELVAELVAPAPADVPAAPTAAVPVAATPLAAPAAAVAAPAAAVVTHSSEQTADGDSGDSGECRLQIKDSGGGVACVMTLPSKATLAEVHQQLHARMCKEIPFLAARCPCGHPLLQKPKKAQPLAQRSPLTSPAALSA